MDPISQGALGGVFAQCFAKKDDVRRATVAGVFGGMLADIDVLIRSAEDPLLSLTFHRHFTHSLVFIPVGGLIAALVLYLFTRKSWPGFGRTFLFATLGYATAGLLDACTSYGTHLLWPFSDHRTAWHIIGIIDFFFTLPLLFFGLWALVRRRPVFARAVFAYAMLYLGLGYVQHERAESYFAQVIEERGHSGATERVVKPTLTNLVLWRTIYFHEGTYHIDAVRIGFVAAPMLYAGETAEPVDREALAEQLGQNSTQFQDILRFDHFSNGYLMWADREEHIIGDLRYAIVPNEAQPLWGIKLFPDSPDEHVEFVETREVRKGDLERIWRMIQGAEFVVD